MVESLGRRKSIFALQNLLCELLIVNMNRLSGMPRVKEGWYVYGEIVEQLTTVNIVLYTL